MCYMNSVHCIYLMLLAIGLNKLFLIPDSCVFDSYVIMIPILPSKWLWNFDSIPFTTITFF